MTQSRGRDYEARRAREIAAGFSRRQFLWRASAAAGAAAAGGGALAGAAAAAPARRGGGDELKVWYLASGVDPGADKRNWQESARIYQQETGKPVKLVAQSLDNFIPAWKSALAAKQGPDLQYLWEGVYTLEDAWRNNLEPFSKYLKPNETNHWLARFSVQWDGELWNSPRSLDALM